MLLSVLQAITSVAAGTLVLSQLHAVVPFRPSTDNSFVPGSHESVATTTTVQSCNISRSASASQLEARWPEEAQTDLYEIQLLDDPNGVPFAVYPTRSTSIVIDSIKHHAKAYLQYWVQIRSHNSASQSLSSGWRNHSAAVLCLYVQTDVIATSVLRPEISSASVATSTAFRLPVIRQSEYTDEVDYLGNHNSADAVGAVAFQTLSAVSNPNRSIVNVSFLNSTFSLYCLDVLRANLSHRTRNGDSANYSDYLSCNWYRPVTPSNPRCDCQCWSDRELAGENPPVSVCSDHGRRCSSRMHDQRDCLCSCTPAATNASNTFVGMMNVDFLGLPRVYQGQWYSTPAGTECAPGQTMGHGPGECSWRMSRDEIRVVRGWQLLKDGYSFHYPWHYNMTYVVDLMYYNSEVMRKSFNNAYLTEFSCD